MGIFSRRPDQPPPPQMPKTPMPEPPRTRFSVKDFSPNNVDLSEMTSPDVARKQKEAAALLELVPEVRFALDSVSKTAARAEPILEGPAASATWERLTANEYGQDALRIMVGSLWSVGEVYLVALDNERIEIFPATKIAVQGSLMGTRNKLGIFEAFPSTATIKRAHIPDVLCPEQPTSALFAILPDAKTLLALTKLVRSIASTRSLTGILFFPSEAVLDHHDDDEGTIVDELADSLSRPLKCDDVSAVPVITEMAAEYIEDVRHLQLNPEIESSIPELLSAITRRIAVGLEFPEPLLRAEEANHLEQWAASNALVSGIVEPLLDSIADLLNRGFIQPNSPSSSISFDTSALARPADQTGLIIDAYRTGLINNAYAAQALGFPPEAVELGDRTRVGTTTPNIPRTSGQPSDEKDSLTDTISNA